MEEVRRGSGEAGHLPTSYQGKTSPHLSIVPCDFPLPGVDLKAQGTKDTLNWPPHARERIH